MKANELRIGNYILLQGFTKPTKVFIIDTTEQSTQTKASPIPLTEEWLLKFGFKRFETTDINGHDIIKPMEKTIYYEKDRFTIVRWGINTPLFFSSHHLRIEIKYVHQLQNLYFALTSEDLTYGGDKSC